MLLQGMWCIVAGCCCKGFVALLQGIGGGLAKKVANSCKGVWGFCKELLQGMWSVVAGDGGYCCKGGGGL